jgi:glycosyltransferase involved in cell wall biosynthesis
LPSFEGATVSVASHTLDDEIAASCRWRVAPAPVVPLGVETRDFPVSKPRAPNWAWRLLYVGRVVGIKGVPTLLRAMADLPTGAQLVIDGHAPDAERDDMMDLVRELGVADRVRWRRSPRAALRARYRDADVVVFPSEWAEPFGIVPLEAMACGVPVVATGTGGSGEFLEDDVNCVLFRPGDAPALAAALHRLADDAALRTRVTAGGTATALRMTMDRYAEQLEDLHVAAARRGRGPVHSNADSNQARRARATGSGP